MLFLSPPFLERNDDFVIALHYGGILTEYICTQIQQIFLKLMRKVVLCIQSSTHYVLLYESIRYLLSIADQMMGLQQLEMFFLQFYLVPSTIYQIMILIVQKISEFIDMIGNAIDHNFVVVSSLLNIEDLFVLQQQWR